MAFTVEDGTGVEDANAYVTVAFVTEYVTDRNRLSEWPSGDAARQAAIIAATDYIEQRFSRSFIGVMSSSLQGLSWPRDEVYDARGEAIADEVPLGIQRATAEYALRAIAGKLWADPTNGSSAVSGVIKRKKEKIGPIEEETEYVSSGALSGAGCPSYPVADALIAPFIVPKGSVIRG